MNTEISKRQLTKKVKKKYPKATNITLGSNNITNGAWFDMPNCKHRYFMPVSQK